MSQMAVRRARLIRPASMFLMWLVPMLPTPMTPMRTSVSFWFFFMGGGCGFRPDNAVFRAVRDTG